MGKNTHNTAEQATALRLRVEQAKSKLQETGAYKNGIKNFIIKYPEYAKEIDYVRNLWYLRSTSKEFTKQLEAFAIFKQVELI